MCIIMLTYFKCMVSSDSLPREHIMGTVDLRLVLVSCMHYAVNLHVTSCVGALSGLILSRCPVQQGPPASVDYARRNSRLCFHGCSHYGMDSAELCSWELR